MNLLLDIGNTNVKWAWHDGELHGFGEFAHDDTDVETLIDAITDTDREAEGIWIASVADDAFTEELGEALADEYDVEPEYLEVDPDEYGVHVAYDRPERLGVDRWLAMIGARRGSSGPLVVADAGTALTIDGLLDDGTHVGGLICPGIHLMQDAVFDDTADVADNAVDDPDEVELFAADTAAAVLSGTTFAAVALIEYAADELERISGEVPEVFLTGGAASTIAPLMGLEVHVLRELVLRGLANVVEFETDDEADEYDSE